MAIEERYIAPGHRLSDEDWAAVESRAKEVRQELLAAAAGGAAGPGGIIVDMTARGIASRKYFGVSGIPTQLLVLHSGECPLRAGYAVSLSEWSCSTIYPSPPIASWQRFIDPVHRVRLIPDELGAWHASEANVMSIGWEQAGFARYSRAEWLTPDGRTQMELVAIDMAEVAIRDGIPPRWLTNAEVEAVTHHGNRTIKGFCLHRQIDPDTRTDPGDGYPLDLLMERIKFYMGITAASSTETTPSEEDDMPITEEDVEWIVTRVTEEVQKIADVDRDYIPGAVFDVKRPYRDPSTGAEAGTTTLGTMLAFNDLQHTATRETLLAAVRGIVDAVAAAPSEDAAKVAEEAYAAFAEKLGSIRLTVSADGK